MSQPDTVKLTLTRPDKVTMYVTADTSVKICDIVTCKGWTLPIDVDFTLTVDGYGYHCSRQDTLRGLMRLDIKGDLKYSFVNAFMYGCKDVIYVPLPAIPTLGYVKNYVLQKFKIVNSKEHANYRVVVEGKEADESARSSDSLASVVKRVQAAYVVSHNDVGNAVKWWNDSFA